MKSKKCRKCFLIKSISSFYRNKSSKDGHGYWCKKCEDKKVHEYRKKNRVKVNSTHRKWLKTTRGVWNIIVWNAKKRNLDVMSFAEFDKWYKQEEKKCIYCLIEKDETKTRLSIDRKDNKKGYIKNNLALACYRCNRIKGKDFTYEQMLEIGSKYLRATGLSVYPIVQG